MKKIFNVILVTVLFLSSCQQKPAVVPVDKDAVKVLINEVMDKYNAALNAKDISQISPLLSEDLLFVGTDPSEFWDKKAIISGWEQTFADTTFSFNYTVDKREVKVANEGNSAIVVEQFPVAVISPKIPVRFVYHLIKAEGGWQIDFVSVAFIPKNEEIKILNSALK